MHPADKSSSLLQDGELELAEDKADVFWELLEDFVDAQEAGMLHVPPHEDGTNI